MDSAAEFGGDEFDFEICAGREEQACTSAENATQCQERRARIWMIWAQM